MSLHINKFDVYRDGGTIAIHTDKGLYCIDGRVIDDRNPNKTKKMLFFGYPTNSQPLESSESKRIKRELKTALKEFGLQSQTYSEYLPIIEGIRLK